MIFYEYDDIGGTSIVGKHYRESETNARNSAKERSFDYPHHEIRLSRVEIKVCRQTIINILMFGCSFIEESELLCIYKDGRIIHEGPEEPTPLEASEESDSQ